MSPHSSGVALAAPAVPSMSGVLSLLDDLTGLAGAAEGLRRRVEQLTDLRAGELLTLLAVADGADRPELLAESTGQVLPAAVATLSALRQRGLVRRAGDDGLTTWQLTETGRVVQQQAEALRIRVLHEIVAALGEPATTELRSTVRALGSVLALDGPAAIGPLSGGPRPLG